MQTWNSRVESCKSMNDSTQINFHTARAGYQS